MPLRGGPIAETDLWGRDQGKLGGGVPARRSATMRNHPRHRLKIGGAAHGLWSKPG